MSKLSKTLFGVCIGSMLATIPGTALYASPKSLAADGTLSVQQQKSISGTVKDSKGEAIIGANVLVKGSTVGTITDIDGNFQLNVPNNATLVISFIGYTTKEVPVTGKREFAIILEDDNQKLDEVVVVGYGTQKKVNLTGAVDMVTSEVIENRPVSNLTQGLQGAIPNLQISFADGKPNRSSDYQVRGQGSIGQGGSALILIDGVEGDPAMLNPSDVASVSVLKDASAAAIYGARGTYGVILITTKDPNKEKTSVTYSSNLIIKSPSVTPKVVTDGLQYTEKYLESMMGWQYKLPNKFHNAVKFNDAWLENLRNGMTGTKVESNGAYSYYESTDWFDLLYKDHFIGQEQNINIQGGGEKADFMVSGRYYSQDGVFNYDPDKYNMFNIRAKGNVQVTKWLKVGNNFEFNQMQYHNPMGSGEGSVWYALESEGQPLSPMFNPDGSLSQAGATVLGSFYYKNSYQDNTRRILRNTTNFTIKTLNDHLTINGDITFRYTDNKTDGKISKSPFKTAENGATQYAGSFDAIYNINHSKKYLATNIYAQYAQVFAEKHDVKVMAGYNYEQEIYDYNFMKRDGKMFEGAENINLTTGNATISSNYYKWRIAGGFFRANYAFNDRYLLEVNGRYDGSSKFPTSQQWKFFPSASAGWRVSQEPFWKVSENAISNLKIRASYGSLGNGNIAAYKFQELLNIYTQNRVLNGQKNLTTNSPAPIPEGLTWETSTTANFGGDIAFLNNRLTLSGDYYIRKTKDMYVPGTELPSVYGAAAPKGNFADMTTKGWELTLAWRDKFNLAGKPFNYEIKGTLADSKTKVDSYPNDEMNIGSSTLHVTAHDYYKGMTLGEIWGLENDGYFTAADFDANGKQIAGPDQSWIVPNNSNKWEPGDIKFKDLNGDGKIDWGNNKVGDSGDRRIIGNRLPRYTFSLNLNADWNGIFVGAFFQGVGKQDWWAGGDNSMFWGQYSRPYSNIPVEMLEDVWTEDNPDGYWPRYRGYIAHQANRVLHLAQTKYLQNVAYIRLKNIQVGYSLPKAWISKIHMNSCRIFMSAENLWSWSPLYKHTKQFDVESINGEDSETLELISAGLYSSPIMGDGGSNYSYPILKSVTFGLSVNF